jgi:hypothetical protein
MKPLLIIAFLLASPIARAEDQPNQFVILSMCMDKDKNVYRFSLMSSADFESLLRRGNPRHQREVVGAGYLPDVSALKQNIADRVPDGSTIEWRGWKPVGTCYPSKPIIDDIRAFGASRHIDIRIQKDDANDIKQRAQSLVDRYASLAQAEAEFGTPSLITRSEAEEYLQKTPAENKSARDTWQRFAQYPLTLCYSPGDLTLYVFLDDRHGVVGYYLKTD